MKTIIIILIANILYALAYIAFFIQSSESFQLTEIISSEDIGLFFVVVPLFFSLVITTLIMVLRIVPKMKTAQKQLTAASHIVKQSEIRVVRDEYLHESETKKR